MKRLLKFFRHRKQAPARFTVVELVVSMAVFAVLMLLIMQIFNSLQNVWGKTSNRTRTFEDARTIMDMLSNDLQSVYYSPDAQWVFHLNANTFADDSSLWIVTNRQKSVQSRADNLIEACYWTESITKEGVPCFRLRTGFVSNLTSSLSQNADFNFMSNSTPPSSFPVLPMILSENVISLEMHCYERDATGSGYQEISPVISRLPLVLTISLTMLDDDPTVRAKYAAAYSATPRDTETMALLVRRFTRIINMNRGQQFVPSAP